MALGLCVWLVALAHNAAPAEPGGGKGKGREGALVKVAGASFPTKPTSFASKAETASSFELCSINRLAFHQSLFSSSTNIRLCSFTSALGDLSTGPPCPTLTESRDC